MNNEKLFKNKEFNKLYEKNQAFIYSMIKKFPNVEKEDVVSCGNLAFAKCLNAYSLDKNIKFLTFLSTCIRNEILMFIRKNKKHKNDISFESVILNDSKGNVLTLEDTLSDNEDFVEELILKDYKESFYKYLNRLTEKERQIIRLVLKNKKQREIGIILGINQSYVSRLMLRAIKKLKKSYELEGCLEMSKQEDALILFDKGLSVEQVATELGCTSGTVYNFKSQWNKSKGTSRTQKVESKKTSKDVCMDMFKEGKENKEISEKTGLAKTTVASYKTEFNMDKEENNIPMFAKNVKRDCLKTEHTPKTKLLKAVLFKGELMEYEILDSYVSIKTADKEIVINADKIDVFINELEELKYNI